MIAISGVLSEGFDNPAYGDASWATLFSADKTPTTSMSAGVMALAPHGGHLAAHRHAEAEIYFVAAGEGVVSLDGVETVVAAGAAVFIAGDVLHAVRNDGPVPLRVFYVFPTDTFTEIVYRFEKN